MISSTFMPSKIKILIYVLLSASIFFGIILTHAYSIDDKTIKYPDDEINKIFNQVEKPKNYTPLTYTTNNPKNIVKINKSHYFLEFEKVVFGTIQIKNLAGKNIEIILGEKTKNLTVYKPKTMESISYYSKKSHINSNDYILNVSERYRPTPTELPFKITGVVPFKYVEILGDNISINSDTITQLMIHYEFDDHASSFTSSSKILNDIWELGKYTIKATSYSGLYVDGNRERKPYEADSYINQLGHYAVDRQYGLARYSQLYLLENPTWPTEWSMHSIFMAHLDLMYTGDLEYIKHIYPKLKKKLLLELADNDGLLNINNCKAPCSISDVIDWPPNERDGFNSIPVSKLEFTKKTIEYKLRFWRGELVSLFGFNNAAYYYKDAALRVANSRYIIPNKNVVVNSFHYAALIKMSELARLLGENNDSLFYKNRANKVKANIQRIFLNRHKCLFVDGNNTENQSLHANMFPLAFDLVPNECQEKIISFIKEKGMACSVYGAQYLLEGLFSASQEKFALSLLESTTTRSWANMLYNDSSITFESWNLSINPGMDLNHAWGSAPVNLIARFVMGVRPLSPGFRSFIVKPQIGSLEFANTKIPTKHGAIHLSIVNKKNYLDFNIHIPDGTTADIYIPTFGKKITQLSINKIDKKNYPEINDYIYLGKVNSGEYLVNLIF